MTIIKGTIHVPTIENPQSESDYDVVYPKTTIDQVIDLADKLNTGITASDDFTITAGENVLSAGSNGALQWQGKNIVRSVNGNEADSNGNVSVTVPSYSVATTSANGLMSASDKAKLNGIASGVSSKAYITATYHSGEKWYRVWSDGFIEQGGVTPTVSGGGWRTLTFNKAFTSTQYSVFFLGRYSATTNNTPIVQSGTQKTTTVGYYWGSGSNQNMYWYACGY